MRLFFDIVTGTWGNADDLRIVDRHDFTEDDLYIFDTASDSEIIEYGERWGRPVPPVEKALTPNE